MGNTAEEVKARRSEQVQVILQALAGGPLNGETLREKSGIAKTMWHRLSKYMRKNGYITTTGYKRGMLWHVADGVKVPRKTRSNGHAPVKNTRPAKSNGQVGSAVSELREVIARKQEDLDSLNRSLVILEASL